MKAKEKRLKARVRHLINKRRAKCKRIFTKHEYSGSHWKRERLPIDLAFENMLKELTGLHVHYLQQLLSDMEDGYYRGKWSGDYRTKMVSAIETSILERTLLK